MRTIDFPGTNSTFGKPDDMTDEQCYALTAFVGKDLEGTPFVLTAWMPNYEDLQALNAGRPLMLQIVGTSMPPVSLWTIDGNNLPNY